MKTKILISLLVIPILFTIPSTQIVYAADEPSNASITVYVVPTITDDEILPTTTISNSHISNEISITASQGEYEAASFVIRALNDITSLEVEATQLNGRSGSIPSNSIDIRVVKCWYQAGNEILDNTHKNLTPELLLKDDSLIKVENEHNYLKKTDGTYMWISDPTLASDRHRPRTIYEIPVQDSTTLQPVDIPANTNKQFWITIKIPDSASAGSYTSSINLSTPTEILGSIELSLEVLPIHLLESPIEHSTYYYGRLDNRYPGGTISRDYKSEQQLRAELENLYSHGVTNPAVYQGIYQSTINTALLGRYLAIRNEVGMGNQPLYYLGLGDMELLDISKVPGVISVAQSYGATDTYFYGIDECLGNLRDNTPQEAVDILLSQRSTWEVVHVLGGKMFVAGVKAGQYRDVRNPGEVGLIGDLLDVLVCAYTPSRDEAARWHALGHRVFVYANPAVGEERPETYRRNYGLILWQADYDGAMNWAWNYGWGNLWNDFDDTNGRDRMFSYPTIDGVIDTIQWEGYREGVDDIRYMATLLDVITTAKEQGMDTSTAEAWITDLKDSNLMLKNLDVVRSEMIDHILSLYPETQNNPPVLSPIGNRSVNEGEPLEFTVSATDADLDNLTYSVSNLPQGATFNSQTLVFSWTPEQAETYTNVHFEVSDGSLIDSENITVTVSPPSVINNPPVLSPIGNRSVNEGEPLEFTVSATDADLDNLTYSVSNLPQGATFNSQTLVFSWTPEQAETYTNVHFEISDGSLIDSEDITITVSPPSVINNPPVLSPIGNRSVNEGEPLEFTVSATDADLDNLTYSVSNLPQGATFNSQTLVFSWTPEQAETYTNVHFEVSDGSLTDSENITVTVSPSPASPLLINGGGFMLPPSQQPGFNDISNIIDYEGTFTETVTIQSEDGKGTLTIQQGTKGLTAQGEVLDRIIIEIQEIPPPPTDTNIIGLVYDFGPDGASFDSPIIVTFNYEESLIPEGVDEKNATIAIWDDESGSWIEIESFVNPEDNTITGSINHFSIYTTLISTVHTDFTISNLSITPDEIYNNEIINTTVLVTNIGDIAANYEVNLRIDGSLVETKEVTVSGGTQIIVKFRNTQNHAPGIHTVDINSLTGTFEVKAPPITNFIATVLNISPNIANPEDTIIINTQITNTGNISGTCEVILMIDGMIEATREITIDANTSEMVSLTTMKKNAGTYIVEVNGVTASFAVNDQSFPETDTNEHLVPEISTFEFIPHYHDRNGKILFGEMVYEINNPYKLISDVDLIINVWLDDKLLDKIYILPASELEPGMTIGSQNYIPTSLWKKGTYTFQALLNENGEISSNIIEQKIEITKNSAPKVVSWNILGIIIISMLSVTSIIVFMILHRRRDMFEA